MATRNILDNFGNVIGTLTLSDSTTESQWSAALAPYSSIPTLPVAKILDCYNISDSNQVTTSSSNPAVINGMTKKPDLGTYIILFNGSIYTDGASATGEFGIYIDGVLISETRRDISCNLTLLGGLVTISLNAIGVGTYTGTRVDLNGSQTIDVRFRSTNGGTIGFKEKVLTLLKVA